MNHSSLRSPRFPRPVSLAFVLAFAATLATARADQEQDLVAVLRSGASPTAKAEACKQLRLVATPGAVPALAALLPDPALSQAARYALEGIPGPEPSAALRRALTQTTGSLRTGIIDSLGWLRDPASVAALAPLLDDDADPPTAAAIAAALARIGGDSVLPLLEAARAKVAAAARPAVLDALLVTARRLAVAGQTARALDVFRSLTTPAEPEEIRVAAHFGWMRAAGDQAQALVLAALRGTDPAAQTAALQCAPTLTQPAFTRACAELLPGAAPGLQLALLSIVRERDDATLLPVVRTLATGSSTDPAVRRAALSALGDLGDASVIPFLAQAATATDPTDQSLAREALAALRRGEITGALAGQLDQAEPPVQRELLRALASRADPAAIAPLLRLAREGKPATRSGALQTLGQLANGSHLAALLELLVDTTSAAPIDEVQGVFETLVERFGTAGALPTAPLSAALAQAAPAARRNLLPVAALFVDDQLRGQLRAAVRDTDASVRDTAIRAVAKTRDPALLPDLLELAGTVGDPKLLSLVLEGATRLATDDGASLPLPQRADALVRAYAAAKAPGDRRLVVASLGGVPHRTTLDLAGQASGDPGLRPDAEAAALRIARALAASDFATAEAAITRLAETAGTVVVRTNAQALLKSLDSGWLCTGPYRRDGKRGDELFDVPFPPEIPGSADPGWRRAPGTADLTRVGEVDLGSVTGGDHCIVYARTRVYVPRDQTVQLALGSDDGLKVWVNGTLVHANNAVRGLTPGQDRAKARLREGWNDFLVKITQSTAGCGLSMQVTTEAGAPVQGLRLSPTGGQTP